MRTTRASHRMSGFADILKGAQSWYGRQLTAAPSSQCLDSSFLFCKMASSLSSKGFRSWMQKPSHLCNPFPRSKSAGAWPLPDTRLSAPHPFRGPRGTRLSLSRSSGHLAVPLANTLHKGVQGFCHGFWRCWVRGVY